MTKQRVDDSGNGKVTLAKIGQRLDDYIEHTNKALDELKKDSNETREIVHELKNILIQGEGKIKRNYQLISEHERKNEREKTNNIKLAGVLAAIISAVVSVATFVVWLSIGQ